MKVSFSDEPVDPKAVSTPAAEPAPPVEPVVETPAEPAVPETPEVPAETLAPESAPATSEAPAPEKPKAAKKPKDERKGRAEALAKLTTDATNGDEPEAVKPGDKPAEPATPAPAKIEVPADLNEGLEDKDKIDADEYSTIKGKTRARIDTLLKERAGLKADAKMGKAVLDLCNQAGLTDAQFGDWTKLGVGFMSGDPEALAALKALIAQGDEAESKRNPAPPAVDPKAPLPAWLQKKVDDYEMSEAVAREVLVNSQPQRPAAPAPRPTPLAQTLRPQPEIAKMSADIAAIETEAAAKYKSDWPKIKALVWDEIKKAGTIAPSAMAGRVRDKLDLVVAQLRAKTPNPTPPPTPIKASSSGSSATTPKTGREAALKILTR